MKKNDIDCSELQVTFLGDFKLWVFDFELISQDREDNLEESFYGFHR